MIEEIGSSSRVFNQTGRTGARRVRAHHAGAEFLTFGNVQRRYVLIAVVGHRLHPTVGTQGQSVGRLTIAGAGHYRITAQVYVRRGYSLLDHLGHLRCVSLEIVGRADAIGLHGQFPGSSGDLGQRAHHRVGRGGRLLEPGNVATVLTHPTALPLEIQRPTHGTRIVLGQGDSLTGGNLRLIASLACGNAAQVGNQPIGIGS